MLLNSVRRSLAFSLAESYLGVALQLISTLIIARLLTPAENGIFAVAAVLSALASALRDFGVGEYLIQEKDLTATKIRAALAANIVVSWLMASLLFLSSSAVAEFYAQPGVGEVVRIQAISFLLIPFGAVTMAYFRRQLDYRPVFFASIFANVTSFVVAIAGVLAGFSYLSLAWSTVAGVIVTVGISIFLRPKDFPAWPSFRGVREVVQFGKHATGIYLFSQIGKNAPQAVIGRVLDMASVAFFSRANGLMEIFNRLLMRSVMQVCLPYFSLAAREQQGTNVAYVKATSLLTGIGWPFFVFVAVVAHATVRLLYGPQWTESVPLAQILCVAAVLELPHFLASEVMISVGRIDQSSRLQVSMQGMRLLSLLLIFPFGVTGVCWGLVASTLGGAVISQRYLYKIIGLRVSDMFRACLPSAIVTGLSVIPISLLAFFVEQTEANYVFMFFGGALATLAAWLIALRIAGHPFWPEVCSTLALARGFVSHNR